MVNRLKQIGTYLQYIHNVKQIPNEYYYLGLSRNEKVDSNLGLKSLGKVFGKITITRYSF